MLLQSPLPYLSRPIKNNMCSSSVQGVPLFLRSSALHEAHLDICHVVEKCLKMGCNVYWYDFPGVNSVTFDSDKNLLFVAGPVDAMELINSVAELDREVRLLPNINPRKKTNGVRIEEIPTHQSHDGEGHSSSSSTTPRRRKGKAHERPPPPRKNREEDFDFYRNPPNNHKPNRGREKRRDCPRHQKQSVGEEEHKREAYVPFSFGDRVCRDFYCLKHPPVRDLDGNCHASDDGYSLMRTSPFLGNFGSHYYGGGFPGMYGARPTQYGFRRPFGFQ